MCPWGRCPLLLLRTFSTHAKVVARDAKEMRNTQDTRSGFVSCKSGSQARIQGRWNGWIFIPPPPLFWPLSFFFLSLKYWCTDLKHLNQALVLLHYYKNSPPISKSCIRAWEVLLISCGKNASFFNRRKTISVYLVSSLKTEEVCACCYFCRMIDLTEHFIVKQKSILKHQKLLLQDVTLGAWVLKNPFN